MQPHELIQRYEDVQTAARQAECDGGLTSAAAAILVFAGIVDQAVTKLCRSLETP